ncbi:MAG: hypothetical protein GQ538_06600 [Xanthomonadales bacterium]|nr:hypothetical protein [Xanthomonadales bacterium]
MKYQNGNEDMAETKNNQSVRVMVMSPRFSQANSAINIVMIPETPIGHAPAPALPSSCARKNYECCCAPGNPGKHMGFDRALDD